MDVIPADARALKSVAKANQWKVVGPKVSVRRTAS